MTDHTTLVAAAIAAPVALIAIWQIGRALRRLGAEALFLPVLAIALALTVDGMRHLAVGPMRLHGMEAWIPAVFYESVGLYLAYRAERRLRRQGDMGTYGPMVIVLGVLAGLLAAGAGQNPWASAARLAAPIVAVALWWVRAHDGGQARTKLTWLWSPRRLAIWLRIIAPGERDEVSIDRMRRVRALTRVGHRATTWPRWAAWWYRSRLAALARVSTPDMLADAAGQVRLGRAAIRYMTSDDAAGRGHFGGHEMAAAVATVMAAPWPTAWPQDGQPDGHDHGREMADSVATDVATTAATDVAAPTAEEAQRDLAKRLRRGQTLTRPIVMDLYGVSDGTAGRWLTKAKAAVADKAQINGKRI